MEKPNKVNPPTLDQMSRAVAAFHRAALRRKEKGKSPADRKNPNNESGPQQGESIERR